MMVHSIGQLTAEIVKVDLSSLDEPGAECVLEDDLPQLKRIHGMVQGLVEITLDKRMNSVQRRTQLESIRKTVVKIEESADLKIKAMDRRKINTRTSQDLSQEFVQEAERNFGPRSSQKISIDVFREAEQEFAIKKASAMAIHQKARDAIEQIDKALVKVPEAF